MQSTYYTTRILAFGVNPDATEAKRSPWPRPKAFSGCQQSNPFIDSIDDFSAWEQQQIRPSHMDGRPPALANCYYDLQDAAQYFPKNCEFQNAYCFLSPSALKSSHFADDADPFLKCEHDEAFFCEKEKESSSHTVMDASLEPTVSDNRFLIFLIFSNAFDMSLRIFTQIPNDYLQAQSSDEEKRFDSGHSPKRSRRASRRGYF